MAYGAGWNDERDDDRGRKRAAVKESTVVHVPKCADPDRRKRLEADDVAWLLYYFGPGCELDDVFWYPFVADQIEMIRAVRHAILHGADQAIAAPRGSGKSTIAERQLLKAALAGEVNYSVLCASTGGMADNALDAIKTAITDNPLLEADYPEVCIPVKALEGAPQRAQTQRVSGDRHDNGEAYEMAESRFSWCGQEVIFPKVPGSPSAGAIIATRGLDAAVRGLKKRGKRPKLVIVDDPDTEDTSRSEDQANKLERRIDAALGFLGGQQKSMGRVILTTLQSRIAVSFRYTDPKQKPTFKGRRFRYLVVKPSRRDLCDEYVSLRREDFQRKDAEGNLADEFCRRSHQFWCDHREEIEADAVASNPHRFDNSILPDGSLKEVSAVQHYYNEVARVGQDVVSTEFDNDPPDEKEWTESSLTAERVQRQVSGYARGIIPPGCVLLTQGIDCNKRGLHWVVRAWKADGTGYVIAYGVHEVRGTVYGKDDGLDVAIHRAILERMEATRCEAYCFENGECLPVDLTLVDAGYRTDAVYAACHHIGAGIMPIMGFGKSSGCTQADFSAQQRATVDKKPGDGWFLSRKGRLWLVCADADRWKAWEHDRWRTDPSRAGALHLFGSRHPTDPERLSDDQRDHHSYARHILSESEQEKPVKGVLKRIWVAKHDNNHWFDASYYSDVAMSLRGVRIEVSSPSLASRGPAPVGQRKTFAQMKAGKP